MKHVIENFMYFFTSFPYVFSFFFILSALPVIIYFSRKSIIKLLKYFLCQHDWKEQKLLEMYYTDPDMIFLINDKYFICSKCNKTKIEASVVKL